MLCYLNNENNCSNIVKVLKFWTKTIMPVAELFLGGQRKGEKKLVGKRESWYPGNGERLKDEYACL